MDRPKGGPPTVPKVAVEPYTPYPETQPDEHPRSRLAHPMPRDYYPILLAFGVAMVIAASMILLSYLLGRQTGGRVKLTTVESGVPLLDVSHKRISVAFFLVAIDFIVFDIEAAFLYPWALVMRAGGWTLFAAVMAFVFLILVGYVYIWRKGGLDLGPQIQRSLARSPGR